METVLEGYALLVDKSFEDTVPIADGVYCFDEEAECIEFAVELLIEAGHIARYEHGLVSKEGDVFKSNEEALEWFQDDLESMEYFHVREFRKPLVAEQKAN